MMGHNNGHGSGSGGRLTGLNSHGGPTTYKSEGNDGRKRSAGGRSGGTDGSGGGGNGKGSTKGSKGSKKNKGASGGDAGRGKSGGGGSGGRVKDNTNKRERGGGRKAAEAKTEEPDDAGSDSIMTGQLGHSEGGEVDGRGQGGGGGGGGGRGDGGQNARATDGGDSDDKGDMLPVPLAKKPRTQPKKGGPKKDQSAADILISIMKA